MFVGLSLGALRIELGLRSFKADELRALASGGVF
jgi:hypothetical protein